MPALRPIPRRALLLLPLGALATRLGVALGAPPAPLPSPRPGGAGTGIGTPVSVPTGRGRPTPRPTPQPTATTAPVAVLYDAAHLPLLDWRDATLTGA